MSRGGRAELSPVIVRCRFSGFLFAFSDLFTDDLAQLHELFGLLGDSVELVVRASTYGAHNRTAALLDRETGPNLTWKWTLAVVACAALGAAAGVFKRNASTKLNSISKIN